MLAKFCAESTNKTKPTSGVGSSAGGGSRKKEQPSTSDGARGGGGRGGGPCREKITEQKQQARVQRQNREKVSKSSTCSTIEQLGGYSIQRVGLCLL